MRVGVVCYRVLVCVCMFRYACLCLCLSAFIHVDA